MTLRNPLPTFTYRQKKRKKTLKWLFKAFTMQAASYMCLCVCWCVYTRVCVSMCMQPQLTSAHTDPHTWRHTQSPHRNPHTSRSSQKTLSYSYSSFSVSLFPSHPLFFPLSLSHTRTHFCAIKNCAKLSAAR